MGITHHSNYVRWMEEARIDLLDQIGWGLEKIEKTGVAGPIVSIECRYKRPTTFPELITVYVTVEDVRGAKLILRYKMLNVAGQTVFEGRSENCFTDSNGKVLRLDRNMPELYNALLSLKDGVLTAAESPDQAAGQAEPSEDAE